MTDLDIMFLRHAALCLLSGLSLSVALVGLERFYRQKCSALIEPQGVK